MTILERDPFVDKRELPLHDGKIDYSNIIQVKERVNFGSIGAGNKTYVVSLLPGINTVCNVFEHNAVTNNNNPIIEDHTNIIDLPICHDNTTGDHFVVENNKAVYWRLLSYGAKCITRSSNALTSGYVEIFDEPMTTDYSIRYLNGLHLYNNNANRYLLEENVNKIANAPYYENISLKRGDSQEFVGSRIDNHHNFIHIPKLISVNANYAEGNRQHHVMLPRDNNHVIPFYFDFSYRKKNLIFHLEAEQDIELIIYHNYEFFEVDSYGDNNIFLEDRNQHHNALGDIGNRPAPNVTPQDENDNIGGDSGKIGRDRSAYRGRGRPTNLSNRYRNTSDENNNPIQEASENLVNFAERAQAPTSFQNISTDVDILEEDKLYPIGAMKKDEGLKAFLRDVEHPKRTYDSMIERYGKRQKVNMNIINEKEEEGKDSDGFDEDDLSSLNKPKSEEENDDDKDHKVI